MCRDLEAVRQSICDYAKSFDAASLTAAEAGRIVELCATIQASVTTIKSLAAARLADSGTWKHHGYRNAEEQLADRSGIGTGQARRTLNNARRLADHPDIAHAALHGQLSAEQAELVAAGADADRSKTAELIERAKTSTLSELRDQVAQVRANRIDREAQRQRIHQSRKLRSYTDLEGVWHLHTAGNIEDGITLTEILTPIRQRLNRLRRDRGQSIQPFEQLDYDALITLAQIANGQSSELSLSDLHQLGLFPQHTTTVTASGPSDPGAPQPTATGTTGSPSEPGASPSTATAREASPARDASLSTATGSDHDTSHGSRSSQAALPIPPAPPPTPDPPASPPQPPPPTGEAQPASTPTTRRRPKLAGRPLHLIIRVDLDTLLRGVPLEGELCEIPGYGPIPVSLIQELKANHNLFISAVLTKSRQIIGVYRHRRRPDTYQQTALDFLYPTCAAAGCNRRAGLDYEHREDWAQTHYTAYHLMDRLCWHHHQQKTHHGWKLTHGTGKRPFVPPTDPRHPDYQQPTPGSPPPAPYRASSLPGPDLQGEVAEGPSSVDRPQAS